MFSTQETIIAVIIAVLVTMAVMSHPRVYDASVPAGQTAGKR